MEEQKSSHSGDEEVQALPQSKSPWPHLDKFLLFKRQDGNNYVFRCKLCIKHNEIRAHKSSFYNAKNHFKKIHPSCSLEIDDACKSASLRGKKRSITAICETLTHSTEESLLPVSRKQARQQTISESLATTTKRSSPVTQTQVETALVNMIVFGMYPLSIVESQPFRDFAGVLNPTRQIPSRRTVGRRISESFDEQKELLIR